MAEDLEQISNFRIWGMFDRIRKITFAKPLFNGKELGADIELWNLGMFDRIRKITFAKPLFNGGLSWTIIEPPHKLIE